MVIREDNTLVEITQWNLIITNFDVTNLLKNWVSQIQKALELYGTKDRQEELSICL